VPLQSSQIEKKFEENARSIDVLARQNDACAKRLENLEGEIVQVEGCSSVDVGSRLSVMTADTVASVSSTWESIF